MHKNTVHRGLLGVHWPVNWSICCPIMVILTSDLGRGFGDQEKDVRSLVGFLRSLLMRCLKSGQVIQGIKRSSADLPSYPSCPNSLSPSRNATYSGRLQWQHQDTQHLVAEGPEVTPGITWHVSELNQFIVWTQIEIGEARVKPGLLVFPEVFEIKFHPKYPTMIPFATNSWSQAQHALAV